jgi:hypothetical protein
MRTDRHRQDKASAASTLRRAMGWSRWLWSIERISKTLLAATLGAALFFAPRPAAATDSAAAEPDWEAKIYAFGWFPAIYSNPEIGPFKVYVNIKADDLFRHFRWGGGAGLEDRYKDFLLLGDGMAAQFALPAGAGLRNFPVSPGGVPGTLSTGPSDVGLRTTTMMIEGSLGWRALSLPISSVSADDPRRFRLDLLAGARLWYYRNKITLSIPPARLTVGGVMVPIGSVMLPREVKLGRVTLPGVIAESGISNSFESTTSWVDAVIGFRAIGDVTRTVSLTFRGDVGGFSIGNSSNFTWQAKPGVEWRFTEHMYCTLDFRAIGFDKGRASNSILYGLDIGVGYRF